MADTLGEGGIGIDGITFTAGGRYYMNLSNSIKMLGMKASLAPGSVGSPSVMEILESMDLEQYISKKLPKKQFCSRTDQLGLQARLRPKRQGVGLRQSGGRLVGYSGQVDQPCGSHLDRNAQRPALRGMGERRVGVFQGERFGNQLFEGKSRVVLL